jgi:bifunctional enzyme CysN/CysC
MGVAIRQTAPSDAPDGEAEHGKASLLHVMTCGSVDDGKSTLLGRLLFDSNSVLEDQLSALDRDSRRFGTHGQQRDFALLIDGLSAEREQGITIDVAYRYFATDRRAFIMADTPGHEQYTRNMATGASTADLAIILVDARKGILPQTRRHSYIVAMLGVRHVVLAVNKMDLVGFSREIYERIAGDYGLATESLGFVSIVAIPLCAREGDNITTRSVRTPWYDGPALLDYLETISISPKGDPTAGSCFPVQWVNRPSDDFRGYAGTVASGTLHERQSIVVLPGGQRSRIASIVTADGLLETAVAGQAITLTLADEIDVSRGDVIARADQAFPVATKVTARLLWMDAKPLAVGRSFVITLASAIANARVVALVHAIDIQSFERFPAAALDMNGIGVVELAFDRPLVVADYATNRELGAFILIDRATNQTVALGVIEPEARPSQQQVRTIPTSQSGVELRVSGIRVRPPQGFWRNAARRLLQAGTLGGLTFAFSRDPILGGVVSLGELAVCPVLDRVLRFVWPLQHKSKQKATEPDPIKSDVVSCA